MFSVVSATRCARRSPEPAFVSLCSVRVQATRARGKRTCMADLEMTRRRARTRCCLLDGTKAGRDRSLSAVRQHEVKIPEWKCLTRPHARRFYFITRREAHTRGVASKLLLKMGFKGFGAGLGRDGQGRSVPVQARTDTLRPPGRMPRRSCPWRRRARLPRPGSYSPPPCLRRRWACMGPERAGLGAAATTSGRWARPHPWEGGRSVAAHANR